MKTSIKLIATLATALLLPGCNHSDDALLTDTSGTGSLHIEYDNSFAGNDLILNAPNGPTSQLETLRVTSLKYIVSNIALTDENGQTFRYPGTRYFIASESDPSSLLIRLHGVPAANYTQIRFGIGVDEHQWALGASGQGDLLAQADAQDMLWSWSAGYKFVAFEGKFTSPLASDTDFMIHTGKTGTGYNYREITLDLPQKAIVRPSITPQIHVVADCSQLIDGLHKIKLSDHNTGGLGAMIMGGEVLGLITENLSTVFSVDHVHND